MSASLLVQLHLYHVMEPLLIPDSGPACQPPAGEPVPLECNGQITVNDGTASCQPAAGPATPIPCDGTIVDTASGPACQPAAGHLYHYNVMDRLF